MPHPVLIDTDAGVDDALALLFALQSPELSIEAITTVAGNVGVRDCTLNVLTVLSLLGPQASPEVAEGARKPLRRSLFSAPEVHGADGLGNVRRLLWGRGREGTFRRDAVNVIIDRCLDFGRKLTIIAIGPLTNIARAWNKNPAALKRVGRIITMGGAFRVSGNTGPVAEFNYYVDPEAAGIVLNSGLPITVIPLDVTQQLVLMRTELEVRAQRESSRMAQALVKFTKSYMQYHSATEGFNGGYLHDPLAVAVAIDPAFVQTERAHVDVECAGTFTRGMTVADFRQQPNRKRVSVDVATNVDRKRFFKLFHGRLWG